MATIQLTTTNYNGESGIVYFWPCNSNGNASLLGTHTFPYEIVDTDNYEGTYEIGFTGLTSGNGQICYVQIPCSGCNRPTGLTQTDLYVTYSDGVNSVAFTGSTFDVCTAANNLNNNVWYIGGSLSSQIGPDNTVYKTAILGDCATIEDGYYILLENGVYVARQISGGILGSPIDCNSVLTSTPTPTPAGPTATPTPTPFAATATPTPTPNATATPTPTGAPTGTPTPTPEPATATPTPIPATSTPTPTPQPPQTYAIEIAVGGGGPSGTACQNAQSLAFTNTVYSLFNNGGQLSTSTETLYSDVNATIPFDGSSSVYSDGTVYGTINSSGVFVYQGNCSGI
jgi:hypothetical protein